MEIPVVMQQEVRCLSTRPSYQGKTRDELKQW